MLTLVHADSGLATDGLNLQRVEPRRLYRHSKFVSEDGDVASKAWESILPSHGAVAIEPEYALAKSLPDTIKLPDSSGNLLYATEAYHTIHCVFCMILLVFGHSVTDSKTR